MSLEPGIHTISAEDYHRDPCPEPSLSASLAARLAQSTPLHAWASHPRLNPDFEREESGTFDLGNIAHALILEDASKVRVIEADSWRTKDAQEERDAARAEGAIPLLAKDYARVERAIIAIRSQLALRDDDPPLFTAGKPEQTLVWQEQGVWCRARLDWLRGDCLAIDDLKTSGRSANPLIWGNRTLWNIGADVQAAFYLRGLKRLTGKDATFRFCLAESTPPFAVSVVSLLPEALEFGALKVDRALAKWRECLESGDWPGYPAAIYYAETPAWHELQYLEHDGEALAS